MNEHKERARQAVIWGADRLASLRRGREFIERYGYGQNFLTQMRNHQNPPMSALLAMSEFLEMTIDQMLDEAWAHREEKKKGEDQLVDPKTPPPVAGLALRGWVKAEKRVGDIPMCERLETIDELRYSDPMLALMRIEDVVLTLPSDQIPYALQIASSCYKQVCDFREAAHCLRVAREMADESRNRLAIGDNLQRWIYVFGSVGFRRLSFDKNQEATSFFLRAGSLRKIGESLVDLGYCNYYLGNFQAAAEAYCDAEDHYGDHMEFRTLAGLQQGIAIALLRLNMFEGARQRCCKAVSLGEAANNLQLIGTSHWTLARVELATGSLTVGGLHFEKAVKAFKIASPLDAVMALLEWEHSCVEHAFQSDLSLDRQSEKIGPILEVPAVRKEIDRILDLKKLGRLTAQALADACKNLKEARPGILKARAVISEG